jgi:excisionase family DNA binding protein
MSDDTVRVPAVLTVEEVASYLRVSRALVYRLSIRYSKVASKRRYLMEDVQAYLTLNSSRPSLLKKVG